MKRIKQNSIKTIGKIVLEMFHIFNIFIIVCSINMLKLPEYKSKEELHNRLMIALQCGNQGYAFA